MYKVSLIIFGAYLSSFILSVAPVRMLGHHNFWSDVFKSMMTASPLLIGLFLGIGILATASVKIRLRRIYIIIVKVILFITSIVVIPTSLWALSLWGTYRDIEEGEIIKSEGFINFSYPELTIFLLGITIIFFSTRSIIRQTKGKGVRKRKGKERGQSYKLMISAILMDCSILMRKGMQVLGGKSLFHICDFGA